MVKTIETNFKDLVSGTNVTLKTADGKRSFKARVQVPATPSTDNVATLVYKEKTALPMFGAGMTEIQITEDTVDVEDNFTVKLQEKKVYERNTFYEASNKLIYKSLHSFLG